MVDEASYQNAMHRSNKMSYVLLSIFLQQAALLDVCIVKQRYYLHIMSILVGWLECRFWIQR